MPIFAIYNRWADTCGNEGGNLIGYYRARTLENAQKVFQRGFLSGFEVEQVVTKTAKELKAIAKKER